MQSLSGEYEFVFVDAPHDNLWIQDPPQGKDNPTVDINWASESIDKLDQVISEQGPFQGIIGYSQGAAMIPVYLSRTTNSFDFAIMYCGYLPETHLGLMQGINDVAPFQLRSLVFSGEYDYAFKDLAEDLADKFSNCISLRSSSAGHHVPYESDSVYNSILNFILDNVSVTPSPSPSHYGFIPGDEATPSPSSAFVVDPTPSENIDCCGQMVNQVRVAQKDADDAIDAVDGVTAVGDSGTLCFSDITGYTMYPASYIVSLENDSLLNGFMVNVQGNLTDTTFRYIKDDTGECYVGQLLYKFDEGVNVFIRE